MGMFDMVDGILGTDLSGNRARDAAIAAQTGATNAANATQWAMYDQNRKDLMPWLQAGEGALGDLQSQMPDLNRSFTLADFTADPGYQFRMSEGMKAIERSAAAKGGLNSGATMKALSRYNQDFASNEYTNAYNRFNNDRTNRYNKLAGLAGIGQTASGQLTGVGQNTANTVAANQIGLGNSQAAANIAASNQQAQLLAQGGTAAALAFSDERVKTNVENVSAAEMTELKKTLRAVRFNYVDDKYGQGDWVGVMAQDLEKSKLGRTLVTESADGIKMLNLPKVMSLFLATLAEAH